MTRMSRRKRPGISYFAGQHAGGKSGRGRADSFPAKAPRIESLIRDLNSEEPIVRSRARMALVAYGRASVAKLTEALERGDGTLRWEAAQALAAIRDPASAPILVRALEDESSEVRWTAADALIDLGRDAVIPLLEYLVVRSGSVYLREAAHRVLSTLGRGEDAAVLKPVREAIESSAPIVALPVAAHTALRALHRPDRHPA